MPLWPYFWNLTVKEKPRRFCVRAEVFHRELLRRIWPGWLGIERIDVRWTAVAKIWMMRFGLAENAASWRRAGDIAGFAPGARSDCILHHRAETESADAHCPTVQELPAESGPGAQDQMGDDLASFLGPHS